MFRLRDWNWGLYHNADDKGGAGGNNGGGSGSGDGQGNTGSGSGTGDSGQGSGGGGDGSGKKEGEVDWNDPVARQKELDRIAGEARRKGKEKGKEEAAAEAQRAKDEEARKAREKQGEFKDLYETEKSQHETAKTSLQEVTKQRDRYAERITGLIEAEIKEWPEELTKLDPGKDKLDERLEWVEKSRDLAKRLMKSGMAPRLEGGAGGNGVQPTSRVDSYMSSQYYNPNPVQK